MEKIGESLEGDITIEPGWLSDHVGVLAEDHVQIDPAVWSLLVECIERREMICAKGFRNHGRRKAFQGQAAL